MDLQGIRYKGLIAAILLTGVLAIGIALMVNSRRSERPLESGDAAGGTSVRLYFADPREAGLRAEERIIAHGEGPGAFGSALIEALIDGPNLDLAPTLPSGAAVKNYDIRNGVAYVDLNAATVSGLTGGSESELLAVYSIVNTVCLNLPEVEAVKILIEGESVATLKGHMDLRFAFKPDQTLIRQQRGQ